MSELLNLFPYRAAIGRVTDDTGKEHEVFMTPEFARALAALMVRVGGDISLSVGDLEVLALSTFPVPPVEVVDPQLLLPPVDNLNAIDGLNKQIAELQLTVQSMGDLAGQVAELRKAIDSVEMSGTVTVGSGYSMDWEHPGKIGASTPNSGAFTALIANGAVTLSPANANVVMSPTGTGTVTIAPVAAGTINNLDIGTVTPRAVAATTITATGEVRSTQPIGGAYYGMWSTAANAGSRNWALAMNSIAYGQCHLMVSNARLGDPIAAGTIVWTATAAGLAVTAGFGCNGAAVQTAAASGGAMATTAATNVSPYGFTTAAQADSIATKLNAIRSALVANGIMS